MTEQIYSPRWTKPAIVVPGSVLTVIVSPGLAKASRARLTTGRARFMLRSLPAGHAAGNDRRARLSFELPAGLPPGLYDLAIDRRRGRPRVREPNCVWQPAPGKADFKFVHISDFHIARPGRNARMVIRAAQLRQLMIHLRDKVRPDFIINTGDLVTRYGPDKKPLPIKMICRQLRTARRELTAPRIPQFITPGNHDVAFPSLRIAWNRLMGGRWDGETDDYGFDYRGVRFIALDRALEYDHRHRPVNFRLAAAQKAWLARELAQSARARARIVFCHYDYTRELVPLLEKHRVAKVLYGHSDKEWIPGRLRRLNGHLLSAHAYQTVIVAGRRVVCKAGLRKSAFADNGIPSKR